MIDDKGNSKSFLEIGNEAFVKLQAGNFKKAIELYDSIIQEELSDLSFYCNSLYALQNDNNHLGVNREMNYKFLKYCLPYGPVDPDIYYNAACLYMEMEEFDKAIDCIEFAIQYGSTVIYEAENHPLFKPLFQFERFKKAFKKNNTKTPADKNLLNEIKEMLKKDIDIDTKNENGKTPLMRACSNGDLKSVKLLIENNASLKEDAQYDNFELPFNNAAMNGHTKILKYLLDKGAYINDYDRYNRSALFIASSTGNLDVIKFLIENGADINSTEINGITPFMISCRRGYYKVAKYLIENKADINKKSNAGETALISAAMLGYKDIVDLLIENNADNSISDSSGLTALMHAQKYNHTDIVNVLK